MEALRLRRDALFEDEATLIRRAIVFVLAVAMVLGGSFLLFEQLTASRIIYGLALFGGAFLVVAGLGLLWEDFIAPLMKGQGPS